MDKRSRSGSDAEPDAHRPGNWSLRYFRHGDDQGLLDLLTAAFPRWPNIDIPVEPLEHLRWKLRSDVPNARFYHHVSVADSMIVGCQIVLEQAIKVRDHVLPACHFAEMAIRPDFQHRGMMKDLWFFKRDDFERAFRVAGGTSGSRIVQRQKTEDQREDLAPANRIEVLEHPLRPQFNSDSLREPAAAGGRPEWTVRQVRRFDHRINEFWEEASQPFDFIVVRTEEYMNWRYADPRAGLFEIRLAEQNGRILGYSVLTRTRDKGHIADLLTLPGRDDVVQSLAGNALQSFRGADVSSVRCWSPSRHPFRGTLLRLGFRPKREMRGLSFSGLGGADLGFLADPEAAIHVTAGDTDLV